MVFVLMAHSRRKSPQQLVCSDGTAPDVNGLCADGSQPQGQSEQLVCSDGTAPDVIPVFVLMVHSR